MPKAYLVAAAQGSFDDKYNYNLGVFLDQYQAKEFIATAQEIADNLNKEFEQSDGTLCTPHTLDANFTHDNYGPTHYYLEEVDLYE